MDVQRVTLEETGNQLPINTSTSTDAPSTLQVTANEVSGNVNGQGKSWFVCSIVYVRLSLIVWG